jgi:hypothetical protein
MVADELLELLELLVLLDPLEPLAGPVMGVALLPVRADAACVC